MVLVVEFYKDGGGSDTRRHAGSAVMRSEDGWLIVTPPFAVGTNWEQLTRDGADPFGGYAPGVVRRYWFEPDDDGE